GLSRRQVRRNRSEHPCRDLPHPAQGQAIRHGVAAAGRGHQARVADEGLEIARQPPKPMLLIQVIVGGLLLGAIYALFSSGLTLIWGMMNFINFAHGEFVMLGMYVALIVVTSMGGGPTSFSFLAAGLLATLGIAIYFALIRHVIRGPMMAQILSTFGLALLL